MATTLSKLQKFERDFRQRVDTTSDQLFLAGSEEVPANYKSLIEEYSKALGKSGVAAPKPPTKPATPPPAKPGRGGGQ